MRQWHAIVRKVLPNVATSRCASLHSGVRTSVVRMGGLYRGLLLTTFLSAGQPPWPLTTALSLVLVVPLASSRQEYKWHRFSFSVSSWSHLDHGLHRLSAHLHPSGVVPHLLLTSSVASDAGMAMAAGDQHPRGWSHRGSMWEWQWAQQWCW